MKTNRPIILLAVCCLAISFTLALGSVLALDQNPDKESDQTTGAETTQLLAQTTSANVTPVIVGLRVDGYDAQLLARSERYETRMSSNIADIQDVVLASLDNQIATNIKRYDYIPYMALTVNEAGLIALRNHPLVTSITVDQQLEPLLDYSVPLVRANLAHLSDYRGQDQMIAILDSGVDRLHPDLAGKVISEACFSTNSSANLARSLCPNGQSSQIGTGAASVSANSQIDGHPHGTTVAGIAAAVAPRANIMAITVMSRIDDVTGSSVASLRPCSSSSRRSPCVKTFTSDLLAGMQHVYAQRNSFNIAAVNVSIGFELYGGTCDSINPAMTSMVAILRGVNIATVAATGNNGQRSQITFPACISNVISVGSTIVRPDNQQDRVATLSNINNNTTLLAPGEPILAPVPVSGALRGVVCRNGSFATDGLCLDGGTSLAAPHVAGAVAVMRSANNNASVSSITSALANSGPLVSDQRSGGFIRKRRLDVYGALCAVTTCDPDDYRTLFVNQSRTGSLSTSPRFDFDYYFFDGVAGQPVTIRMDRTSGDIDPIINLRDSGGQYLTYNNDGGGGVNALIRNYYLPRTARYTIMVNSARGNTSGTYSLRLTQEAPNQNPPPFLNRLTRNSATLGSPQGFYVGVEGENFIPSSVVRWDGSNRYTVFVNSNFLWFYVYTTDLRVSGPHNITVYNGSPGGGTSSSLPFFVNFPRLGISALLAPEGSSVAADLATTFAISWTHPTDSWRVMQNIDFWFEDSESLPLFKLRFSEGNPTSTISILDTEGIGVVSGTLRSGEFGENRDLVLPDVLTLHLGQTRFFGSGRDVVISPTISFDEEAAGNYTMAFSIDDDNNEIQDSDVFGPMHILPAGCTTAIQNVALNGPTTGMINEELVYKVTLDPLYPTYPVSYLWSPEPASGQGTAQASYSWDQSALYSVQVTAENCAGFQGSQMDVAIYSTTTPDLYLSKLGPPAVVAGQPITYTLMLTNTGALTATSITLVDEIPSGATYVSGGNKVGDSVVWSIPELSGYGSVVTETFVVTAGETVTNSNYFAAAQGGYDATGDNDVITTIVDEQILATPTQTATLSAAGKNAQISLTLPPGTVFAPTMVTFSNLDSPPYPAPESWDFGGEAFAIAAYQDGREIPGFQFGDTVAITIDPASVKHAQASGFALYHWNGVRWSQQGISCSGEPVLTCSLNTPSTGHYALWSAGSSALYLPVVRRP